MFYHFTRVTEKEMVYKCGPLEKLLLLSYVTCFFLTQISNNSELSINYSLKLDSQSPLRHSRAQVLPSFLPPFSEMAETQLHVLGRPKGTGTNFGIFFFLWDISSSFMYFTSSHLLLLQVLLITMVWPYLTVFLHKGLLAQVTALSWKVCHFCCVQRLFFQLG